jgi:hypothetical protein
VGFGIIGSLYGVFHVKPEGSKVDGYISVVVNAILLYRGSSMKRLTAIFLLGVILLCYPLPSQESQKHVYLCRSPLLAFDFWNSLQDIKKKGITLTPEKAQQVCDGMKAGKDPQCIRVEVDQAKPVASGWGGALALTDGRTKVWFHNPDSGGWVHPDYYVYFVNLKE